MGDKLKFKITEIEGKPFAPIDISQAITESDIQSGKGDVFEPYDRYLVNKSAKTITERH